MPLNLLAQVSTSFELRYYSKDKATRGQTDFRGKAGFFDTEQRIEFLDAYADAAAKWFSDSSLNKKVNTTDEINRFLDNLKPAPLPVKRTRLILDTWKKASLPTDQPQHLIPYKPSWDTISGVKIANGAMLIKKQGVRLSVPVDSIQWRFLLTWKAKSLTGVNPMSIALKHSSNIILEAGFHSNGNIFFTRKDYDRMAQAYEKNRWYEFRIEGDLTNNRYNLLVDGEMLGFWTNSRYASLINKIEINAGEGIVIDDLQGIMFDTTGCLPRQPYQFIPFINQTFDQHPNPYTWPLPGFDDMLWKTDQLPIVHGGVLQSGEDLLLRKTVVPPSHNQAWINIETLDPGGEIWVNGRVVYVTHDRYPVKINISNFLIPHQENTIGIRIYNYFNDGPLYHASLDRNTGWFCGRAWIDFTEDVIINHVKVATQSITEDAVQQHKIAIENHTDTTFTGDLEINYYPWHPVESRQKTASFVVPVSVFAKDSIHFIHEDIITAPSLWTHDNPELYKVEIRLSAGNRIIDDEVAVTGIRTVSQERGIFRINGEPELLGGTQTMGFRMAVENNAKWNRCAPATVLADELLASKKLGNLLRIHVHSGGTYAHSINDPRIAEMADQLGLMLIWPTTSWIRQGEWGGIDFEGYPKYMDQVFNHPSIVMWEGSNHPNKFKGKPVSYSNRFVSKIYNTIAGNDSSRLISPSSYNRHFAYRNDEGTIDKNENTIAPCPEWTAPLIVRGNQDALTGYGKSWDAIMEWPDAYRQSFIESTQRAYFNFEHEESIGMQNFSLAKGKPWYQMPSYENIYDEGSVGRQFTYDEWRASQGWQAFSAWESMKWQRMYDIDGFSWCCLHGGPNSGTYRKPLIDAMGHAKLSFYIN
ncbi:MAG TPA: hypothetical protein VJ951_02745, partial [Bacteroidales bacterium]|nr:hypothetical protein [Bacteroidales bacterium]